MSNQNLKNGTLKKRELELYGVQEEHVKIILDYQKKLPILQTEFNDESVKSVSCRKLYEELGLAKSQYSRWTKKNIVEDDLSNENEDYTRVRLEVEGNETYDYMLTLDYAKELSMTVRNKNGKLVRKYFIIIEKAFKERVEWNNNRMGSIEMCKELKRPLNRLNNTLRNYIPSWFKGNVFSWEFNMLNQIIIKQSAKQYRRENKMNDSEPIRNTFDKDTLEIVHELEKYDAILIEIQGILNWEDRKPLLDKYYNSIKNNPILLFKAN